MAYEYIYGRYKMKNEEFFAPDKFNIQIDDSMLEKLGFTQEEIR